MSELPVVVVGAGPVGLAAAAELRERGLAPLVLEKGPQAGAAVAQWHHVRLFSRWGELVAPAARRLLAATRWTEPDPDRYPTGSEWARDYLAPLAEALGDAVVYGAEVTGITRGGRDRLVDSGRADAPFAVRVRHHGAPPGAGAEESILARAVVDASGTWSAPGPLGADGLPALGEAAATPHITYRIPDLDDPAARARHAGRHTVVAGSGHSALTALTALAALAETAPGTRVTWLLRRGATGTVFGGGRADQLPARGALGQRAKAAVDQGRLTVVTGFRTAQVTAGAGGTLTLTAADGRRVEGVDQVVALTGFRPDLSFLSEVRLGLDPVLQAPAELAPLIDPNAHSCGTVPPHGAAQLAHPEPGFYLAGMKSYGRAPTFLALTGYEQVRSIAAALAGDAESAGRVELTLPETGVCGGAGVFDDPSAAGGGGCCAPAAPQLVTLGAPAAR